MSLLDETSFYSLVSSLVLITLLSSFPSNDRVDYDPRLRFGCVRKACVKVTMDELRGLWCLPISYSSWVRDDPQV